MDVFVNFKELFLSVCEKGILGINFYEILIGIGIFLLFLLQANEKQHGLNL